MKALNCEFISGSALGYSTDSPKNHVQVQNSLKTLCHLMMERIFNFVDRSDLIYPYTSRGKEFFAHMDCVRGYIRDIIKIKRQDYLEKKRQGIST